MIITFLFAIISTINVMKIFLLYLYDIILILI